MRYLLYWLKVGFWVNTQNNKFSIIISQPMKNFANEDIFRFEESEIGRMSIIDSNQIRQSVWSMYHSK